MIMDDIKKYGSVDTQDGVITYNVLGADNSESIFEEKQRMRESMEFGYYGRSFNFGNNTVATFGKDNRLPTRIETAFKGNPKIPQMLKKMKRIMYGHGPFLYIEQFDENGKQRRIPVTDKYPQAVNWLESWERYGFENYKVYLNRVITDYYHIEGYFNQWHFNGSRITRGKIPVRALEYKLAKKCRLGMSGILPDTELITDKMCNIVLYNHWDAPFRFDADIYDRLNPADPLASATAINYVRDMDFGDEIYSILAWYEGLEAWIEAANLNPKYINSFLKHSLNAKVHVIIPDAWIRSKADTLEKIINKNKEISDEGGNIVEKFEGIEIGTTFNFGLVQKLIDHKIKTISQYLSGAGKNQGKAWFSTSFRTEHGIEKWEFEDFPSKYKEFISSLLDVDKRSGINTLAGIGLDPAISNVSNEGVFNSGSQVYYAYMVYLDQLQYPEDFICQDINRALHINFPVLRKDKVKLGFVRFTPERQQQVDQAMRMENQQ